MKSIIYVFIHIYRDDIFLHTYAKVYKYLSPVEMPVTGWGVYAYLDLDDCIKGEKFFEALLYFE